MSKKEFYQAISEKHKAGMPWNECCKLFNNEFGTSLNEKQLKERIYYNKTKNKSNERTVNPTDECFTQRNSDGTLEARKIVAYQQDVFGNPDSLLEYLGFDSNQWEFINYSYSSWEQNSTENGLTNLYAVKFKLKPKTGFSPKELMKEAIKVFKGSIRPIHLDKPSKKRDKFYDDTLLELCPVELHLGKIAESVETGEDYNLKIASTKFRKIVQKVIDIQAIEMAGRCLVVIGNDFFNSEFDSMTYNKTPQQNDTRYKTLFNTGLSLYRDALATLREYFPKVDVMMCVGNHARAMEFFMYVALQQYFRDDAVISFSNDLKDTQAYQFGKCAIFYNHGDPNLKQLIKSIPAEFYEMWGRTYYRELHLGHLHKEVTVDDESGMITRRIGSPCNTDAWHYQNRYVGATKKHQVFIWNANNGLQSIQYING